MSCLGWSFLAATGRAEPQVVEDELVRFQTAPGWTATGEGGEYRLESEQNVASLLLLPPDPLISLDVRLAEIEAQFLSTGVIHRERSETRDLDGDLVRVRCYRLEPGGAAEAHPLFLHQYSFERSDVHVLLQMETLREDGGEEELFRSIFETLTIVGEPAPFAADEPAWDGPGIGAEPFEAIVDSSDATVYEPEEPGK
jgi:hypothetical protein